MWSEDKFLFVCWYAMERKKSKMPMIGIPNGCMGGLFHFIGFNQHLHIKKILAHNKKGSDLKQIESE